MSVEYEMNFHSNNSQKVIILDFRQQKHHCLDLSKTYPELFFFSLAKEATGPGSTYSVKSPNAS